MTTATMSRDQLRQACLDVLATIAPEKDYTALDPTVNVRETLDIDSFDFLNVLIELNGVTGVEIPEADYGQLVSLNDIVDYLSARL